MDLDAGGADDAASMESEGGEEVGDLLDADDAWALTM